MHRPLKVLEYAPRQKSGAFGSRREALVKAFTGRPRTMVLTGIALFHSAGHLGEAVTVRSAGGFGTGV